VVNRYEIERADNIKDVILLKRRSRRDLDVVGKKNDNFNQAATVE